MNPNVSDALCLLSASVCLYVGHRLRMVNTVPVACALLVGTATLKLLAFALAQP